MTPQTDEQIAMTLEWLRTTMESGTDFISDQAPLYASELLTYGWVSSWAILLLLLLSIAILIPFVVWCVKRLTDDDMDFFGVFGSAFGMVAVCLAFGFSIASATDLIKIKYAPRVYILEHIR